MTAARSRGGRGAAAPAKDRKRRDLSRVRQFQRTAMRQAAERLAAKGSDTLRDPQR